MADQPTSELARAVQDITEKAQLLVREEIELAKAEMTDKVTKLIKGAVFGIVAGVFAVFALIYLLQRAVVGLQRRCSTSPPRCGSGFLITGVLILVLGVHRRVPRDALHQEGLAADAAARDRGGAADQGHAHRARPDRRRSASHASAEVER